MLDESQEKVVSLEHGHFLVLAPPGCGKTHILAERIRRTHQSGMSFDDMLCLTFTNRAAREMQKRNELYLMEEKRADEEPLFIGNVHRFCSKFLFEEELITADTSIIDDEEAVSIIADFLNEDEEWVMRTNYRWREYQRIIFLSHLIEQKECGHPHEVYLHPEVEEDCLKPVNVSYARQYTEYKRENHLLDFEDLLIQTYNVCRTADGSMEATICRRYRWIQIDEVQDLNGMQLAIIDLLTAPEEATVMYLGDEQQAIFSFMGAKVETLDGLKNRCQGHVYHLMENHRSPKYLLDVFNDYAAQVLRVDRTLLPMVGSVENGVSPSKGYLRILPSSTLETESRDVALLANSLHEEFPEETTAVVVNANADADGISEAMTGLGLRHFKVSGRDLFDTKEVKLLLAHLSVLSNECDFIAWARLLKGLKVFSSNPLARRFLRKLRQLAISPADLIRYDGNTCMADFVHRYGQEDMVVFDTETTGTDTMADDVIEIAAMRVRQGRIVGEPLDLYIRTDKDIPAMLGSKVNPMVAIYREKERQGLLMDSGKAVERFLAYVGDSPVVGHNVMFDVQMVAHTIKDEEQRTAWMGRCAFDTLHLMHLLEPGLHSYKLESLLERFRLTGENSHRAIDDVEATVSLLALCHEKAAERLAGQQAFISHPRVRPLVNKLRANYGDIYLSSIRRLYLPNKAPESALVCELKAFHTFLVEERYIDKVVRLHYLTGYLQQDILMEEPPQASLAWLLGRHLMELGTMKESDFCNSNSLEEKVYVTTVHKAKGLEFDNVIVFDAVAGRYPNFYNKTQRQDDEDARKFYVAISRAKKRLFVAYSMQSVDRYGGIHNREITPFMNTIMSYFDSI